MPMPSKTLSAFLLAALVATSALADATIWEGRIAAQKIHNENRQGFQQFSQTLFDGMGNSGGGFNGGGMQLPPAGNLIMQINARLMNDMSPVFRNQFANRLMQLFQVGNVNPALAFQQLEAFAQQLENNPDSDSQRGALNTRLAVMGMQGASPQQVAAFLSQCAANWDRTGATWHRTGNFGLLVNQLFPSQSFSPAPVAPFPGFR